MDTKEEIRAENKRFQEELMRYPEFKTLDDPTFKRLLAEHKERCRQIMNLHVAEYCDH